MNIHKTKIEWATHTWNPVTGCRHGCEYCYARAMTRRFSPRATQRPESGDSYTVDSLSRYVLHKPVKIIDGGGVERPCNYPFGFEPCFYEYTLDFPEKRVIPSRIFVSSMGDLFGEWVPDEWIERVFDACSKAPQHVYMFLTKNPARYLELAQNGKLPKGPNYWYGSTATNPDMPFWYASEYKTFVSIEPMLAPFPVIAEAFKGIDWLIVGAMTGPGSKKAQPEREWVESLVNDARANGVPVFMKDNIRAVWGDDLIQELPTEMQGFTLEKEQLPHCKTCDQHSAEQQGKRGQKITCQSLDRHVPRQYTRTSPPWCPRRGGETDA